MNRQKFFKRTCTIPVLLVLSGCITVGGGNRDGAVSGSAGDAGNKGSVKLQRCAKPVATVAVVMENSSAGNILVRLGLPPDPKPAVRMVLQQSNCAQVVHRDVALTSIKEERLLARSGELKKGSRFQKGQLVAANYTIIPEILFSEGNSGGLGGALVSLGSLFGPLGSMAGIVGGGVRFKEAQVLLTLVNNHTGVQVATASGSASATDFGAVGALLGTTSIAAGGYQKTNQGKVVIAAIVAAMNELVPHLKRLSARK